MVLIYRIVKSGFYNTYYVINSNSSEHHRKIAKVLLNMSEFLLSKDCVMGFIDEVGEKK